MRNLLILLGISVMTTCHALAQEEQQIDRKTARKLARDYGKMQMREGTEMNAFLIDSLIGASRFMIRATYVSDPSGDRTLVNERTNFVAFDTSRVMVQYSLEYLIGDWGLDGFAVVGTLTRFAVEKTGMRGDMYSVDAAAVTNAGDFSIFAIISPTGEASATIDGFSTGTLTYYGTISYLEEDEVLTKSAP